MAKGVINAYYKLNAEKLRGTMRFLRGQRGNSLTWIAKFMEVSRNTVTKWYNRSISTVVREKRTCKFNLDVLELAVKYKKEGFSLRDIAKMLNDGPLKKLKQTISHSTVAEFIKENKENINININ